MKKILCATDFTEASITAGKYAKSLAFAFNATVTLFHSYEPIPTPAETLIPITPADMKEHAMRDLADQAQGLGNGDAPGCLVECEEGHLSETIIGKVKRDHIDLIVVGMKMEHKGFRKIFGSAVTSLGMHSPVPVLVVPEAAVYRDITSMALAVEEDAKETESPYLLDAFREVAERFHSAVYIVKVFGDELRDEMKFQHKPHRLVKMLRTTDPVFDTLDGNDVVEELLQYIETRNLDMLAILGHKSSPLEKLFSKSVTKQLLFSAHIPLLIIPESANVGRTNQINEL